MLPGDGVARGREPVNLASLRGRFDETAALGRAAVANLPADAPLILRLGASFTWLLAASEMLDKKTVADISAGVLERGLASMPSNPSEATLLLLFAAASETADDDERWLELRKDAFDRFDRYAVCSAASLRRAAASGGVRG